MFTPVELVNPVTGQRYTARNAVDLNDRTVEGYTRAPQTPATPSYKVTSWKSAPSDEDSDTDSDIDSD